MHDGRFRKIQEVVNHYTSKETQKSMKRTIILSSNEKVDLIAFLLTLNDKDFVFNPNFQYPQK
jgi:cytochrome c peroxidase